MTKSARKPMTFLGTLMLLGAIVSFFGFHIVSGDRGLLARPGLELKIVQAEEKLALLTKHQRFLQQRIALLHGGACLLYTSPSPRDGLLSRMPSSA